MPVGSRIQGVANMQGKWTAGPFSWLTDHWNHSSLYVIVCLHFSLRSHCLNLVCYSRCVCLCVCLFHRNLWYSSVWSILIVLCSGEGVLIFCLVLFLSCFARSDASAPTPDVLLILEVRVILTRSSFNWQIEWISLTTSLSHGTLLYLTRWVELTCHLRGLPANSLSASFSHSLTQIHLRKLFLSSSLCLPLLCLFFSHLNTDTLTQTVSFFLSPSSSYSCAFLSM